MKKLITLLALLLVAPMAFADTTTYTVEGMHCGSCAKMITSHVCKLEGLEKCEVSVGKVVLTTKPGATVSQEQVQNAMAKAGDYKITGSTKSK